MTWVILEGFDTLGVWVIAAATSTQHKVRAFIAKLHCQAVQQHSHVWGFGAHGLVYVRHALPWHNIVTATLTCCYFIEHTAKRVLKLQSTIEHDCMMMQAPCDVLQQHMCRRKVQQNTTCSPHKSSMLLHTALPKFDAAVSENQDTQ